MDKTNEQYADNCDKLAECAAIKTREKHYGRWLVRSDGVETMIKRPDYYDLGVPLAFPKDRDFRECLFLLASKEFIGIKGIIDYLKTQKAGKEG